jgi:hypothetical protein
MIFYDLNIQGLAKIPDQIPGPYRLISKKNRLAVFFDPNQVQLNVINCVRILAIVLHDAPSLLKFA